MDKLEQNGYLTQVNKPNGPLGGNWYPQHRPLQIYRKHGKTDDGVHNLTDTDWLFNGVKVHIVFGTFWYEGYGYVALEQNPVAYVINGVTYSLQSIDATEAKWTRSDNGSTVTWTKVEGVCQPKPSYTKPYKMLGKKLPDHSSAPTCCPNTVTQARMGSISSFSGRAQIRSATTLSSSKYFSEAERLVPALSPRRYYADTSQYLRSRGESYNVNNVLSKVEGVVYAEGCDAVWPNRTQIVNGEALNSSVFQSCGTVGKCTRTIYKPSNSKFAVQGAVSSAERLLRLKTETKVVRTTMTGKKLLH